MHPFVSYRELFEWSINKIADTSNFQSTTFNTTSIMTNSSLAISVFRGKSPKYDSKGKSIILNQKCNRWNSIETKYAKNVNDNWFRNIDKKFLTIEGDILINSTGEGTIGRASFIGPKNINLLYDSHLLLLRFDIQKINPLYFTFLFNSIYGQSQVDNIKSAQSTKQTELGVNNLKKIVFPLPPIEIQNKIANHISDLKYQIKDLKTKAKQNRDSAIKEFEQEIFS